MGEMLTPDRRKYIWDMLIRNGSVKVSELAKDLNTSEGTIRRDLTQMENEGLVQRIYGGAVRVTNAMYDPSLSERSTRNLEEKRRIAEEAVRMIQAGDVIGLSAGTTTAEIAHRLRSLESVTVVTNGLNIAAELANWPNVDLHTIGGRVRRGTMGAFGPEAEAMLSRVNLDKLFLGVNGIHAERGVTSPTQIEASFDRRFIEAAQTVIIVCDHSKVGRVLFSQVVPIDQVDLLITDKDAPHSQINALREAGVEVRLV